MVLNIFVTTLVTHFGMTANIKYYITKVCMCSIGFIGVLGNLDPIFQLVFKGTDANISCRSDGGTPLFRWKGRTVGTSKLSSNRKQEGNTLILSKLKRKHSGIYFCRGYYKNMGMFQDKSELYVGGRLSFVGMELWVFDIIHFYWNS